MKYSVIRCEDNQTVGKMVKIKPETKEIKKIM